MSQQSSLTQSAHSVRQVLTAYIVNNGVLDAHAQTINMPAPLSYSYCIFVATSGGLITGGPITFNISASVTGTRYCVATNGVIDTNGTTYPGSGSSVKTGGQALP
jgi:hypothetical protein